MPIRIVSVCTTIGLRIAVTASPGGTVPRHSGLATAIDVSQIANLILSLLTNMTATIVISIWAWCVLSQISTRDERAHRTIVYARRYRVSIALNLKATSASTQVERIMILVAESGVVYCISSVRTLNSTTALSTNYVTDYSSYWIIYPHPWRNTRRHLYRYPCANGGQLCIMLLCMYALTKYLVFRACIRHWS